MKVSKITKKVPCNQKNPRQAVRIGGIVLLYLFFFSSPLIFKNESIYNVTPIGEQQALSPNRSVIVNDWSYCQNQHIMEIQLGFINNSYDGNNEYSFSAISNGLKLNKHKVNVIVNSDDLYVIQIPNIPSNFSQIRLTVSLSSNMSESVNLFSSKKDVTLISSIENKNENEYRISSIERKIEHFNNEISEISNSIDEATTRIENLQIEIEKLKSAEQYQTAAQILKTESSISQKEVAITTEENSIDSLKSEITEYLSQIELSKKEIEDLEKQ